MCYKLELHPLRWNRPGKVTHRAGTAWHFGPLSLLCLCRIPGEQLLDVYTA